MSYGNPYYKNVICTVCVPYSKVCRDGLMMVNWPKHVAKEKIK